MERPVIIGDYSRVTDRIDALDVDVTRNGLLAYGRVVGVMTTEHDLEDATLAATLLLFAERQKGNEDAFSAAVLAGRHGDGYALAVVNLLIPLGLLYLYRTASPKTMESASRSAEMLALVMWRKISREKYNELTAWYMAAEGVSVGEAREKAPAWLTPYLDAAQYVHMQNMLVGDPVQVLYMIGRRPETGLSAMKLVDEMLAAADKAVAEKNGEGGTPPNSPLEA